MADLYNSGGVVCKADGTNVTCTATIPGAPDGCKESGSTKTCCKSGSCASITTGSNNTSDPTSCSIETKSDGSKINKCCTNGVCTETPANDVPAGCTETVESSGAITQKCCSGTVCTKKVVAKESDSCDCDEKYKYAINDAISRNDAADITSLRARRAACISKCNPSTPTPVKKKNTDSTATKTTNPVVNVRDRRRVVYSSNNQ